MMRLEPVSPQPTYIESSGRWNWPLPEHAQFEGCCKSVVTASREWWEYTPSEARPHPMAEGVQLRDGKWYWAIPASDQDNLSAQAKVRVTDEDVELARKSHQKVWDDGNVCISEYGKVAMRASLESFAASLSQGAQVSISDALNRLEDMAVAGEKLQGDDVWRFQALVERLAPEVSDSKLGQDDHAKPEDGAVFISQGTQGEAVAVVSGSDLVAGRESRSLHWLTKGPYAIAPGTKLYTHSAERAAVPDGLSRYWCHPLGYMVADVNGQWVKLSDLRPGERAAITHGTVLQALNEAGQRYPEAENAIAWLVGALTAAPHPPEGARVVPDEIRKAVEFFSSCAVSIPGYLDAVETLRHYFTEVKS